MATKRGIRIGGVPTGPPGRASVRGTVLGLAVGVAGIVLVSAVVAVLDPAVPAYALVALYVLAMLPVATRWGFVAALLTGVLSMLTFDYLFTPPRFQLTLTDPYTVATVVVSAVTAFVVSALARVAQRRAHEAELAASQESALRRVATLVAGAASSSVVFAAVAEETGRLLGCDLTVLSRYEESDRATVVGSWSGSDAAVSVPVGSSVGLDGSDDEPGGTATAFGAGVRSAVGVPIGVEGRSWGALTAASTRGRALPADSASRLARFGELVATAISNAETRAELIASRARIVAAADAARRRIERDLHDGVQQHLVALGLQARTVQAVLSSGPGEAAAQLDALTEGLTRALEELREIARGLHPAAIAEGGLRPALRTLARRSGVPVRLEVGVDGRLPEPVELATYYIVAEALTNATKHARATVADVSVVADDGVLRVRVRDDGRGGATVGTGTGLVGLTDRVEAFGGRVTVASPPGVGTTVDVELPLTTPVGQPVLTRPPAGPGPPPAAGARGAGRTGPSG